MAKKKTCGQCKHCEPIGDVTGECYRYPPGTDGAGDSTKDVGSIVFLNRKACGEYNCTGWSK